jgi:hypothetical protein
MYFDRIRERTGKEIKDVFPDFSLFVYGGVNFEPYRKKLFDAIGRKTDSVELFPASEGFFAFQDLPNSEGLLLLLNAGIFYEFIPVEEYFSENPRAKDLRKQLIKNEIKVSQEDLGTLETVFFSKENIALINKQLILKVYERSNKQFLICLKGIMKFWHNQTAEGNLTHAPLGYNKKWYHAKSYAIAKYFTLIKVGIDESKLRLGYVKYLKKGTDFEETHMVLLYFHREDAIPIVLDNILKKMELASERNDLKLVYSFNAQGLWEAKNKGKEHVKVGENKLLKWKSLIEKI